MVIRPLPFDTQSTNYLRKCRTSQIGKDTRAIENQKTGVVANRMNTLLKLVFLTTGPSLTRFTLEGTSLPAG